MTWQQQDLNSGSSCSKAHALFNSHLTADLVMCSGSSPPARLSITPTLSNSTRAHSRHFQSASWLTSFIVGRPTMWIRVWRVPYCLLHDTIRFNSSPGSSLTSVDQCDPVQSSLYFSHWLWCLPSANKEFQRLTTEKLTYLKSWKLVHHN